MPIKDVGKVITLSNQEYTAMHPAFLDKRDKNHREGIYPIIFGHVEGCLYCRL